MRASHHAFDAHAAKNSSHSRHAAKQGAPDRQREDKSHAEAERSILIGPTLPRGQRYSDPFSGEHGTFYQSLVKRMCSGREVGEHVGGVRVARIGDRRLSADLRQAFPTMQGFSRRTPRYRRAFAAAHPGPDFWQQAAAQLPWEYIMRLLDAVPDPIMRAWYVQQRPYNPPTEHTPERFVRHDRIGRRGDNLVY